MKDIKTGYWLALSFVVLILILLIGNYTGFFVRENNYLNTDLCKTLLPELSGSTLTITTMENTDKFSVSDGVTNQYLTCEFEYKGNDKTRYPGKTVTGTLVMYSNADNMDLFNKNFNNYLGNKITEFGSVETIYLDSNERNLRSLLYLTYPGYYRFNVIALSGIGSNNMPGNDKEGEIIWVAPKFYKTPLLNLPKEAINVQYLLNFNLAGDITDYRYINFVLQNYLHYYAPLVEPASVQSYRVMTFSTI